MLGAIKSQRASKRQPMLADEQQHAGHAAEERPVDHQPALGDVHDVAHERPEAAIRLGVDRANTAATSIR